MVSLMPKTAYSMNKFEVRYLSQSEYGDWDAFVEKSDYGSFFHKSTWMNTLYDGSKALNFDIIGCFNKDNSLAGGAIIVWKKVFWKLKVSTIPYATPFFGIVTSVRDSEYVSKLESHRFSVMGDLLEFIEKKYDAVTMILPPEFRDIRVFNWRNYDSRVMYTYRGEIKDSAKMIFLPAIRRRIKKAEKLDYKILSSKEDDHLDAVFRLLTKSYERQSHQLRLTTAQFKNIVTNGAIRDQVNVYSVWQSDVPVAAIVIITDGKTGYYWLAGGDYRYFETGLNQLLLWKVIEDLSKSGVELLDLVGANTSSIANYKSGYNFNLEPYYLVSKNTNLVVKLLFSMKDLVAILRRK